MFAVQDRNSGAIRPTQRTHSSPARVGLQKEMEEEENMMNASVQGDKGNTVNQLVCT